MEQIMSVTDVTRIGWVVALPDTLVGTGFFESNPLGTQRLRTCVGWQF
jgi:hypothetical protein